jgi:NADH-quinone oxidoreductase subunit L
MRLPLVLLSIGAVIAGAVFYKYFMKDYGGFWHGALPGKSGETHAAISNTLMAAAEGGHHEVYESKGFIDWLLFRPVHGYPYWVLLLPLVASITGFVIAYFMYVRGSVEAKIKTVEETGGSPLYNFLLNKWYIDELYDATVVRATRKIGDLFWKVGDVRLIDGLGPNGVASFAAGAAKRVSKLQTGYLYHYAFVMLLGVAVLILVAFRGTAG